MFKIPEIKDLSTLLQKYLDKDKIIIKQNYKLLNAPGENYGSLMVALDVTLQKKDDSTQETLHLVAKLTPPNQWIQRMFATHVTFKKEIYFYQKVIPTLQIFQESYKVPDLRKYDMFPDCINARINLKNTEIVDEDAVLLLENLKFRGYIIKERTIGLNFDETIYVLRDLAKFHAIPLAYRLLHPENFKKEILPHINRVNIGQEMFETCAHKFSDSILYNLTLNEDEVARFKSGMLKGFDFQTNFPVSDEKFATFVHCDFWMNNTMLLLNDNNLPIGNKIVDFQVVAYASFATDLVFFLFTSVMQDVLSQQFDYFISVYHETFVQCLRDYNVDISGYTLDDFHKELNVYGPLEMSHIVIMLRAVFADKELVKELTDFGIDEMFTQDGLTDLYKRKLKDTVKIFFEKNWL